MCQCPAMSCMHACDVAHQQSICSRFILIASKSLSNTTCCGHNCFNGATLPVYQEHDSKRSTRMINVSHGPEQLSPASLSWAIASPSAQEHLLHPLQRAFRGNHTGISWFVSWQCWRSASNQSSLIIKQAASKPQPYLGAQPNMQEQQQYAANHFRPAFNNTKPSYNAS